MQTTQNIFGKTSLQHVMTPQLQEAIRILQLSYEELVPFIDQQLTLNPFLSEPEKEPESEDSYDETPDPFTHKSIDDHALFVDGIADPPKTLRDHLKEQINILFRSCDEKDIALSILNYIEPSGYLKKTPHDLSMILRKPIKRIQSVVERMKTMDPTGICALNLEDCLKIQLADKELLTPSFNILITHLSDLTSGKIKHTSLVRLCDVTPQTFQDMLRVIRTLDPQPGRQFQSDHTRYVTPEVFVVLEASTQTWQVKFNPHLKRNVHFDEQYYKHVKAQTKDSSDKQYLSQQLNHANWLCKALQQRSQTLFDVSQEVVRQQQNFFHKGIAFLTPLTLKDVATPLGIHESTVSRITTGKYLSTPHGVFELKYFFTSRFDNQWGRSISSESLKKTIHKLITSEHPDKPLSDLVITEILNAQSIPIARRTVAKYRETLSIPPSFQRKRSSCFKMTDKAQPEKNEEQPAKETDDKS